MDGVNLDGVNMDEPIWGNASNCRHSVRCEVDDIAWTATRYLVVGVTDTDDGGDIVAGSFTPRSMEDAVALLESAVAVAALLMLVCMRDVSSVSAALLHAVEHGMRRALKQYEKERRI